MCDKMRDISQISQIKSLQKLNVVCESPDLTSDLQFYATLTNNYQFDIITNINLLRLDPQSNSCLWSIIAPAMMKFLCTNIDPFEAQYEMNGKMPLSEDTLGIFFKRRH